MARLPIPGQDHGVWGQILNDFLSVELNNDGTLKKASTIVAGKDTADEALEAVADRYIKPTNGIPESDLASSVQTKLNSGAPNATSTTSGVIRLAGDLGGTANAPTVPGLAGKADDDSVVKLAGNQTVAGVKTFSSSPVVPTPTQSSQAATKQYVDDNAGGAVDSVNGQTGAVVLDSDDIAEGSSNLYFSTAERSKLSEVEAGAQVNEVTSGDIANFETTSQLNARDTANRNRANHTGTQAMSTIAGLDSALDGKADTAHNHLAAEIDSATAEDGQYLAADGNGNAEWRNLPGTSHSQQAAVITDHQASRPDGFATVIWLTEQDPTNKQPGDLRIRDAA